MGPLMTDRGRGRERCVHLFLMKCVRSDAKRTLIYSIYSILYYTYSMLHTVYTDILEKNRYSLNGIDKVGDEQSNRPGGLGFGGCG